VRSGQELLAPHKGRSSRPEGDLEYTSEHRDPDLGIPSALIACRPTLPEQRWSPSLQQPHRTPGACSKHAACDASAHLNRPCNSIHRWGLQARPEPASAATTRRKTHHSATPLSSPVSTTVGLGNWRTQLRQALRCSTCPRGYPLLFDRNCAPGCQRCRFLHKAPESITTHARGSRRRLRKRE
jgi:hypothetical protein